MIVFTVIGVIASIAMVGYILFLVVSYGLIRESSSCVKCEAAGYKWTGYGSYGCADGYQFQRWFWEPFHKLRARTKRHRIAWQANLDSKSIRPKWITDEHIRKYGVKK